MKMSDKAYDVFKWIVQYVLPASATLYFALASIWGFPYGDEIVGTIMALDAFLGLLLGITDKNYKSAIKAEGLPELPPVTNSSYPTTINSSGIFIIMNSEVYDVLVWIAQYLLPSIGTFIFAISGIWGFTSGDAIVGTLAAIDTFLAVILGISNAQYKANMALPKAVVDCP